MVKLKFSKEDHLPHSEFIPYNSINRIPFSIELGKLSAHTDIIYSRNFCNGNLIEFRFARDGNVLLEISLVAVNNSTVVNAELIDLYNEIEGFYFCSTTEVNGSELQYSIPMEILKSANSILITWANEEDELSYFRIAAKCLLGTNQNGYLKTVAIVGLTTSGISDVFGC